MQIRETCVAQAALWESTRQRVGAALGIDESSDESAQHLLQRLIAPGELSAKALSLALADLGKEVPVKDIKGKSSSEILDFLLEVAFQPLHRHKQYA